MLASLLELGRAADRELLSVLIDQSSLKSGVGGEGKIGLCWGPGQYQEGDFQKSTMSDLPKVIWSTLIGSVRREKKGLIMLYLKLPLETFSTVVSFPPRKKKEDMKQSSAVSTGNQMRMSNSSSYRQGQWGTRTRKIPI